MCALSVRAPCYVPEDSNSKAGIDPQETRLLYGANIPIRDVKELANLDLRFPMADERSVRSRCILQRLSRVAVFAGMAVAADTHSGHWPGADRTRDPLDTVRATHPRLL
jgi:hypothetical protein